MKSRPRGLLALEQLGSRALGPLDVRTITMQCHLDVATVQILVKYHPVLESFRS